MDIKCVVACHNAGGEPDLYFVKVSCSEAEYSNGEHYEKAEAGAYQNGYDGPMVVFDENDGPGALFGLFEWETASVV